MKQATLWVGAALGTLTSIRILAAVWAAVRNIRGDYYASMPGAYRGGREPHTVEQP